MDDQRSVLPIYPQEEIDEPQNGDPGKGRDLKLETCMDLGLTDEESTMHDVIEESNFGKVRRRSCSPADVNKLLTETFCPEISAALSSPDRLSKAVLVGLGFLRSSGCRLQSGYVRGNFSIYISSSRVDRW